MSTGSTTPKPDAFTITIPKQALFNAVVVIGLVLAAVYFNYRGTVAVRRPDFPDVPSVRSCAADCNCEHRRKPNPFYPIGPNGQTGETEKK